MKCLSLLQPWATLLVLGAKRLETRSWATNYRGPLLIHASKKWNIELAHLVTTEPFHSILKDIQLKQGCIIGRVDVVDCHATNDFPNLPEDTSEVERSFGDFSLGRYAWRCINPVALPEPVPCRGYLGLWKVSPEVLDLVNRQLLTS